MATVSEHTLMAILGHFTPTQAKKGLKWPQNAILSLFCQNVGFQVAPAPEIGLQIIWKSFFVKSKGF